MKANVARRLLEGEWTRLLQVQDAVYREQQGDDGEGSLGELSPIDQHQADVGSEVFEREKELSIRDRVDADVAALFDAFGRLSQGTFGRCETCGAAIPDVRLAAVPTTRFCFEHEQLWELGSLSVAFPDGPYAPEPRSAEDACEQEALEHLEFLPDDDELEPASADLSPEEAALHVFSPPLGADRPDE